MVLRTDLAHLILKAIIIIGYLMVSTECTGRLYIYYKYYDTRGKNSGGGRCDCCFGSARNCDPTINICLRFWHTSEIFTCGSAGIANPRIYSQEYGSTDKVFFGSFIGGVANPVFYSTPNWFDGRFELSLQATDQDVGRDDHIDTVIIRWTASIRTVYSPYYYIRGTRGSDPAIVKFRYLFVCDANYYGGACTVYCVARNDRYGHYYCQFYTGVKICHTGYIGANCDVGTCNVGYEWNAVQHACIDINECGGTNRCEQSCINNVGSYTCSCGNGYLLYNGYHCRDINECLNNQCDQTCTNTIGSYQCACRTGYRVDTTNMRRCNDINECSENLDNCDHDCVNTAGSFYCGCRAGYELASGGACNDINECERNTDQCNQHCSNTIGSYQCSCWGGYYLSSTFTCTIVSFSIVMSGTVQSNTSLRLTWSTTFSPSSNPVSLSYQVRLLDITFSSSTSFTNHAQTSNLQIDVSGLLPYRRYQLIIRAVSNATTSDSNRITLRTNEGIPSTGPMNVDGLTLNATAIRVYWSTPSRENQNGILTTYSIIYISAQQRQMNLRGSEVTVSTSITSYTLTGLTAYTEYWLSVAASTSVGRGPYTALSTAVRTHESIPTAAPIATLNNKTSTSITITLQPPINTALINGVILFYLVSFSGTNIDTTTRDLRVMAPNGNHLSPVNGQLSPLQEGVSYNIRVSIHTSTGGGPLSSILTISTSETVPNGPPRNVQFLSVLETSMSLSWDPPVLIDQNGVIRGYWLSYRGVIIYTNWRNLTLSTSSASLINLEEGSEYTVFICAFTNVGNGPCVQATQSTLEIIPSGVPTMLTIENVATTSISVSWSPPDPSEQNGAITGYNIVAIGQKHDNERFEVNVTGTTYHYQLTGLEEHEGYSISIRARNSIGYGPAAEINVTTSESTPNAAPRNVAGNSTQTSIVLSWSPISTIQQNGRLLNYEINYYALVSFIPHEHVMINVSIDNTEYTITGLEQDVEYFLKVRGYSSIGPGPYSPEISVKTRQSKPSSAPINLAVINKGSRYIQIQWDPPSLIDQNGLITQYQIVWSQGTLTNISITTSQMVYIINYLQPSTEYSISVKSINSIGSGPYSPPLKVTTNEAIPSAPPTHLTVISVTHISANISWRFPTADSLNGVLLGSTINITNTQTAASFIETSTTQHLMVDTLTPYTRYSLVVSVFNSQGIGPYSQEVIFSTQQASPTEPPQISRITDNSARSITIHWATIPTQHQNGPITFYTVNISTSETNLISSQTVNHPNTNTTFTNLLPFTNYILSISASNVAGSSPSDYESHTTLEDRPTGSPTFLSAIPSFTSLTLSCQPPVSTQQNGPIIQYSIRFQSTQFTTNMTQYEITGLEEYTMFNWSIAASTSIGIGPYSESQYVYTLATHPSEPPQNVTARALSYESILVSWEPVPLVHQNGRVQNYIVYYQRLDKREIMMNQYVVSSALSTTLSSLGPFLSYTIYVVCQNTEGPSPSSSNITVMTLEGSPSAAPTNLLVISTSPTTANVSWVGIPQDQYNGILMYYEIVYQGSSIGTALQTLRVHPNQTSAVLVGLHPAVEYIVYIRAFTKVGNGPKSNQYSVLFPESAPNAAPTFINSVPQSDSIFLAWSRIIEANRNGLIINYEVRYSIFNTNNDEPQYINISATEFNTTFSNLPPNTYFEFEIRGYTIVGPGPYSTKYFVPTKPHFCTVCVNGNCLEDIDGYFCECYPGYSGETCSVDVDNCISNECEHGSCKDKVNGYSCECESGYKGQLCDILERTSTCPREVSLKFVWPDTENGSMATLPCSDFQPQLFGNATRTCGSDRSWSLVDLSQCKRKLLAAFADIKLDPQTLESTPDEIIEFSNGRLCNNSSPLFSGPPYTPGEMDGIVSFINELILDLNNQDQTSRTESFSKIIPGISCILSNILDARNMDIFSQSNATKQAIAISNLIEKIAKFTADNYNSTATDPFISSHDNIQMYVAPLIDKQSATFPDYSLSALKDTGLSTDSVYIPESEVSELFSKANEKTPVIALVFSRYLGQALNAHSSSLSDISSRVITVQSNLGIPLRFTTPITLTFTLFPTIFPSIQSRCVYWDVSTERWSESGLDRTAARSDQTICSSNHATSFAVLSTKSSPLGVITENIFVLGIGSAVGLILLLIMLIIVYFVVICSCKLHRRRKKAYVTGNKLTQPQQMLRNNSTLTNPIYGFPNDAFDNSINQSNACDKIDPDLDCKLDSEDNLCFDPDNSNIYSVVNTGFNNDKPFYKISSDPVCNPFNEEYEKSETKAKSNDNPFENIYPTTAIEENYSIENPTYQPFSIDSNLSNQKGEDSDTINS